MTPFPLVDGCAIFDNSSIEKFCCPQQWEYSEIEQKSPTTEAAGRNFGSTMHRGLETRYNVFGINAVQGEQGISQIETAMYDWLEKNPQPATDFRNFNHACKMMRVYNKIYGNEAWQILALPNGKSLIEASFMLPFAIKMHNNEVVPWTADFDKVQEIVATGSTPIYYSGKIDLGIEDNLGIWSFDHKTAFQFGESFEKSMAVDGGQRGYCWALWQTMGVQPRGYIIDAMRVRRPSVKSGFTGESPIDATDFFRLPVMLTTEMIDEWKRDTMAVMEYIFACYAKNHYPRHRWQCVRKFGVCDYYEVCAVPAAQRHLILNSGMFEENKWSKGLKTQAENTNKSESV